MISSSILMNGIEHLEWLTAKELPPRSRAAILLVQYHGHMLRPLTECSEAIESSKLFLANLRAKEDWGFGLPSQPPALLSTYVESFS